MKFWAENGWDINISSSIIPNRNFIPSKKYQGLPFKFSKLKTIKSQFTAILLLKRQLEISYIIAMGNQLGQWLMNILGLCLYPYWMPCHYDLVHNSWRRLFKSVNLLMKFSLIINEPIYRVKSTYKLLCNSYNMSSSEIDKIAKFLI